MAYKIKAEVVAAAFLRLRSERRHEHFVGYLCMCWEAARCGELLVPKPNFRRFHDLYLKVKDAPLGFPYLKPFVSEKPTPANLWLNANVAGSYAKSSLRPGRAFSKVVHTSPHGYKLVNDHSEQALEQLLDGHKLSAVDLALFLYRDYAWSSPRVSDIVRVFAFEFGFSRSPEGSLGDDFNTLFDHDIAPLIDAECFDQLVGDFEFGQETRRQSPQRSRDKVQQLGAEDIVPQEHEAEDAEFTLAHLERISVDGLLSFAEPTEFVLGRLNILVGPNGSGKSNFIDCLRLLKSTPDTLNDVFSDASFSEWLNKGNLRKDASIEAVVRVPGVKRKVDHKLRFEALRDLATVEETLALRAEGAEPEDEQLFSASRRAGAVIASHHKRQRTIPSDDFDHYNSVLRQVRDIDRHPEITRLARLYGAIRIYSEWSFGRESKMREMTPSGRTDTTVSELMDNIALALSALEDTAAHIPIRNALGELKESYEDYVTENVGSRVALSLKERPFSTRVTAKRLSDGTLRFLALAAILLTDKPAPVICIEEPELGMHPDMIRQVARMIISASERSQIVVATHSDLLLSALQDDFDALFTFNAGQAGTFVRKLNAKQFREWRSEHTLGELWTIGDLGGNRW